MKDFGENHPNIAAVLYGLATLGMAFVSGGGIQ